MLSAGDRHGYGIRQDIVDHTNGALALEAGNLYRTIRRLEHDGLIDESGRRPAGDATTNVAATTGSRRSAERCWRPSSSDFATWCVSAKRGGSSLRSPYDARILSAARHEGERVYRALLRLYPASFRRRYAHDMIAFYRDRVRHTPSHARARLRLWLALAGDVGDPRLVFRRARRSRTSPARNPCRSCCKTFALPCAACSHDRPFLRRCWRRSPSALAPTPRSSAWSTPSCFDRCRIRTSSRSSTSRTMIRTRRCPSRSSSTTSVACRRLRSSRRTTRPRRRSALAMNRAASAARASRATSSPCSESRQSLAEPSRRTSSRTAPPCASPSSVTPSGCRSSPATRTWLAGQSPSTALRSRSSV